MLQLTLGLDDLAATRFAVSPIAETVSAIGTMADPGAHALHLPWVRWARQRVAEEPLALPFTWPLLTQRHGKPEFLLPAPDSRLPDIDRQLDLLAATPITALRDNLERNFPTPRNSTVDELYRHPRKGLRTIATELKRAYELLVAPHWERMARILEADIVFRASTIARSGAGTMLTGLHERLAWADGTLRISEPPGGRPEPLRHAELGPDGLVLVPSIFIWPNVAMKLRTTTQTTLRYPARGLGVLWESTPATEPALDRLVGTARARLLTALRTPATTTELARRLGVTPSAVSQHLAVLAAAGLVARERHGRHVVYLATPLGEALTN